MELQQVKTFVAVAQHGSITRAAAVLHLSQPAVSAQLKALEERLRIALFERTARGMRLTTDGERLLPRAEDLLGAHRALLAEAARLDGQVSGRLRLGLGANSDPAVASRLVARLAERFPAVTVALREGDSTRVVDDLCADRLDAGFFNTTAEPDARLQTVEVTRFGLRLVAPLGTAREGAPVDWSALERLTWICPPASSGCGRAVRALFDEHGIAPSQVVEVDRESATRALVAAGTGVGVLHGYTADDAVARGELQVLTSVAHELRVQLGMLRTRAQEPLLRALSEVVSGLSASRPAAPR